MVKFKMLVLFLLFSILSIYLFANNNQQNSTYLAFAETMPKPIGGLPAIYKQIKYPDIAKRSGVEGKVYLLAFINENGKVDDVKLIKGIGAGCDNAAISAVKSTKFSPGKAEGKAIKVKMSLQIQFKLK